MVYPVYKNHIINPGIFLIVFLKASLLLYGDQNLNNIDFNSFDLSLQSQFFKK